ncbi:Leukocyte receptor cluster member 8 [Galdieria sulphuraria]|uniref:SAC3/GANP family protein n=1 Tax=Galdieria sulphuraria TaxID=130081 RepID=M2XA89_GALSU|nr:SAC3/GANP family protein [Galdieria sulphuraria]EME26787.1 SAC3/GANP family protein [Galdieria sulphuraria]GJD11269.1 Leukocyte receptor cluster member 8 [Galdieria sulphuraria]|eukprot:XP_005703307.1 SAC3/GANP family protein [Galdieria sulphuraria]
MTHRQEWKLSVDASGRQYIYNEKLGCSRWLWERYYDENTKHFYLCNVLTGQSVWEATTPVQPTYLQTQPATPMQKVVTNAVSAHPTKNVLPKKTENWKQTNEVEFFTPDGRKYYWDPVTKTSRWANESTNLENNRPNLSQQTLQSKQITSSKKVSIKWKQLSSEKQLVNSQKLDTPFKEPKWETTSLAKDASSTLSSDQNRQDIMETSVQSNSVATLSDSNSIVQSVSEINMDGKQGLRQDVNGNESIDLNMNQRLPLRVKKRKKKLKGSSEDGSQLNTVEPVIMKADASVRIIGTCVELEKPYLRLTSVPDPKDVRPYSVLKKALGRVKNKYKKRKWSYNYTCEQLKSIRQDMTVQGIEDALAVQVYETHGRLALENNDMDEFIQCLTCLSQLYPKVESEHRIEFVAYRILYATYVNSKDLLTSILCDLGRKEKSLWEVSHATQVWKSVSIDNWNRFFFLYAHCPHLGFYLMDKMKNRVRQSALNHLRKAFKVDNIEIEFLSKNFGFENISECIQYFEENEFIFDEHKKEIIISK